MAAVVTCYCFIIVAAVIVLGLGALFLFFVLLYSQRVTNHSCEALRGLLHHRAEIEPRENLGQKTIKIIKTTVHQIAETSENFFS